MFLVHQMVTGSEGHKTSIVGWCRDGHRSGTTYVCMAQLVSQNLQLISRETIVIPQDVVMRRPAGTLKTNRVILMAKEKYKRI